MITPTPIHICWIFGALVRQHRGIRGGCHRTRVRRPVLIVRISSLAKKIIQTPACLVKRVLYDFFRGRGHIRDPVGGHAAFALNIKLAAKLERVACAL